MLFLFRQAHAARLCIPVYCCRLQINSGRPWLYRIVVRVSAKNCDGAVIAYALRRIIQHVAVNGCLVHSDARLCNIHVVLHAEDTLWR